MAYTTKCTCLGMTCWMTAESKNTLYCHVTCTIDVCDSLMRHLNLWPAYSACGCNQLPIDVRQLNYVGVNEDQPANACVPALRRPMNQPRPNRQQLPSSHSFSRADSPRTSRVRSSQCSIATLPYNRISPTMPLSLTYNVSPIPPGRNPPIDFVRPLLEGMHATDRVRSQRYLRWNIISQFDHVHSRADRLIGCV